MAVGEAVALTMVVESIVLLSAVNLVDNQQEQKGGMMAVAVVGDDERWRRRERGQGTVTEIKNPNFPNPKKIMKQGGGWNSLHNFFLHLAKKNSNISSAFCF